MDDAPEFISLLDLQTLLKEGIEGIFPGRVWVRAEVGQIQTRSTGHCYLELVQSEDGRQVSKARAVVWRSRWGLLSRFYRDATGSDLAAGQQILVDVEVSYSELYGLTLVIDDINPEYTLGDAERKRQETIACLEKEGLTDRQKSLTMPSLPYRLAVISAGDAAGYGDFCAHLQGNPEGFVLCTELFPAVMQGAAAPDSIRTALASALSSPGTFDAVLIMRGGGSVLDLACFDDYGLCVAIATAGVPVLTAIGHERDFHVADMVAWRFFKTPTALADLFVDLYRGQDSRITEASDRLLRSVLDRLSREETRLERLAQKISSADPRAVLSRGYTLTTDSASVVLKSVKGLKAGDVINVLMADGRLSARIENVDSYGK